MTQVNESPTKIHTQKDTMNSPYITFSVRNFLTMYATGKPAQVLEETRRYRLDFLGISESGRRWLGSGKVKTQT